MAPTARSIVNGLLDGIFPPSCLGCEEKGAWACERCLGEVTMLGGLPVTPESGLDSLTAITNYQNTLVGEFIRAFKYQRALCLKDEIGRPLLQEFVCVKGVPSFLTDQAPTVLVPVPMDPERARSRGLDHTQELAKLVQEELFPELTLVRALERRRPSETNAGLAEAGARAGNVAGIFEATKSIFCENLLLIDDVYTTGATMYEAAQELRAKGANVVHGLVLAAVHS